MRPSPLRTGMAATACISAHGPGCCGPCLLCTWACLLRLPPLRMGLPAASAAAAAAVCRLMLVGGVATAQGDLQKVSRHPSGTLSWGVSSGHHLNATHQSNPINPPNPNPCNPAMEFILVQRRLAAGHGPQKQTRLDHVGSFGSPNHAHFSSPEHARASHPQAGGHPRPPEVDYDCGTPARAHWQAVPRAVSC